MRGTNDPPTGQPRAAKGVGGLETVIYKFYKNWEEHQKRQRRGREAERLVAEVLKRHGYKAGKLTIVCNNREREIDLAIPPDRDQIRVAIMVRYGVYRDLIKRGRSSAPNLTNC